MMTINNQLSHGLRRLANSFCYATGLDLCTSTNPYVGDDCGYGVIRDGVIDKKKNNAKCPKCRCQIIVLDYKKLSENHNVNGIKVCGIGKDDKNCNPKENLP